MKLIKNANVFAPEPLGIKDVLVSGNKVIAIDNDISITSSHGLKVIDATGQYLVPGFVDSLVHISGGGGEGGFTTRTTPMPFSDAVYAGITSLVGVLGTDSITRSLEDLLAKTKALKEYGLSVYCYSGSYHYPIKTITDSIEKDIMLIDEVIGIGEVAISDHRSSQLTINELAKITSQARVGGMLSGKGGIVSIHLGDGNSQLSMLTDVVAQTDIPISQFYPTHINRTESLLKAGFEYAKAGGYIDFTTSTTEQIISEGEVPAAKALKLALDANVPKQNITFSSDGNASLPVFNKLGKLTDLQMGKVTSLHQSMVDAVKLYKVEFSDALSAITLNPAQILKLKDKGRIAINSDADLVLLNGTDLSVESVFANGKCLLEHGKLKSKAYFE